MFKAVSLAIQDLSFAALRSRFSERGLSGLLIRGATSSFLVQIVGMGIAFVAQILLTRLLGAQHYGYYIYVITWLGLLGLLTKLGMDTTLVRYVAAYKATENWAAFRGLFLTSNRIAFASSFTVSIVTALGIYQFSDRLQPELVRTFYAGCLVLPFITFSILRRAALRGLKSVVWAQLPDNLCRPLMMIVLVVGFWKFSSEPITGGTAMFLQLIAVMLSFLIGAVILAKKIPSAVKSAEPEYHSREWILYSVPLLFFSGMHLVLNKTDTVMLGMFLDTTRAGQYTVAVRIADVIAFGLTAVNMIAAPIISGLFAENRLVDLQRMLTVAARWILAYTIAVSIVAIVAGEFLLGIFGPSFPVAYPALVILVLGQIFNALAGSVGYVMTMTGHQNVALVVLAGSALLNITLNLAMIPLWGLVGAAVATAISTACWNIALVVYVRKKLGLKTTVL